MRGFNRRIRALETIVIASADVDYSGTWVDVYADDDNYSFHIARQGNICVATGTLTGGEIAAASYEAILTAPSRWRGKGGAAAVVSNTDGAHLGSVVIDPTDGKLYLTATPERDIETSDPVAINYAWIAD